MPVFKGFKARRVWQDCQGILALRVFKDSQASLVFQASLVSPAFHQRLASG